MKFGSSALFSLVAIVVTTMTNASANEEASQAGLRGGADAGVNNGFEHPTAIEMVAKTMSTQNYTTRRVFVKYKEGHKKEARYAMMDANKQRATGEPEIKVEFEFDEINTFVATGTLEEIKAIESDPNVEFIEDDPIRSPMAIEGSNADLSKFFVEGTRRLAEDRPYGVDLVQAPEVWEQGITGANVKVCVIDTGIDQDHPDFVTSNLFGDDNMEPLWLEDRCGHGTHVSGTVAAKKDDKGVVGVAPDAEIFTVKVFGNDCGYVYASGIYDAAQKCVQNGAKIISMSLGGTESSDIEETAFESMSNDVLVVAAAGNDGNTAFSYPASYSSVMSVGAVKENKAHASFSQRNSQVDIAAPGVSVLSTFPVGGCRLCGFWNRGGYGAIDGTSMSTPHVSGVAALLLSAEPGTSAAELRNILEVSAEDLGASGRDDLYGFGLVQAKAALQLLRGEDIGNGDNSDGGEAAPPASECSNIPNWHDSDGEQYNCAWYAEGSNCAQYGNGFANNGATANDACCACGGGVTGSDSPPSEGICSDFPEGWHDSFSSFYCAWYEEGLNCERFGDGYANQGKTANQACCACGGGRTDLH